MLEGGGEMNEVIECLKQRRSIRCFRDEQLSDEHLHHIIEAGLYAATAGGRQSPQILVCQDRDINYRLGVINRRAFGEANSNGVRFVSQTQRSIADDDTIQSGFYGAPTVITLFAPERWLYGIHDCTSVAVNMMTAAWSLGVGSCFVSRAEESFQSEYGRIVQQNAGIEDFYIARAHICLGYPLGEATAKPRRWERVRYIK